MVWLWGVFAGTSTHRKIGNCLECYELVNNLPHCKILGFKLCGNGHKTLPRLMAETIASLRSWCLSSLAF